MTFSLDKFRSEIDKSGIAKPHAYFLMITPPADLFTVSSDYSNEVVRSLMFRVDQTELPGKSLATTEYRRGGFGTMHKMPYSNIYSDQNFQIIVSHDYREHKFFDAWMNAIIPQDSGQPITSVRENQFPHEASYYRDYRSTISLIVLNETGENVHHIKFLEAYPIILNPIPLSWDATNQVSKLSVTVAFREWVYPSGGNSLEATHTLSGAPNNRLDALFSNALRNPLGLVGAVKGVFEGVSDIRSIGGISNVATGINVLTGERILPI